MSYSDDFRSCVLQNLSDAMTWEGVCGVFSISREKYSEVVREQARASGSF